MPNRIIKESICESRGLSECSIFAQDLYKRLITYADDYGRFNADTVIMRARLYPRELEYVTEQDIIDALVELAGNGKISFYTAKIFNQGGKSGVYGAFPTWDEHQRVRDSKKRNPDPDDTEINDWYLRRFIPLDMKVAILERDNMKCAVCGKYITSCQDARRTLKLSQGLCHFDHIVPVLQGGRATFENLRLTCPTCNLKRKKCFTFQEILDFAANLGTSPQVAASCGGFPLESESNPNPNPNPNRECARATNAAAAAASVCADFLNRVNPTASQNCLDELSAFAEAMGEAVCKRAFDIALDAKKATWPYIRAILQDKQAKGVKCLAEWDRREEEYHGDHRTSGRDAAGSGGNSKKWKLEATEL